MATVEEIRDYPVKKSNDMIQKVMFNLTAQEFDLLQYIIMHIKDNDMELKPVELSISEYCELAGIDRTSGKNYSMIKHTLKTLSDKSVWVNIGDNKEQLARWTDLPIIDKDNGTVIVQLSSFWEPYLLELKKRYTVTTLREMLPMKSIYGKRMYELLKSYLHDNDDSAYVQFTVDELKKKLLGEEWDIKYKEFKHFNDRVIKPAIRDMEEYGQLEVDMTMRRMGRSYKFINFGIRAKSLDKRLEAAQREKDYFEQLPGQQEMIL